VRPGAGGHAEAKLVFYWARRILRALGRHVNGAQLVERARAAYRPGSSWDVAGYDPVAMVQRSISAEEAELAALIRELWADAYLAGVKEGRTHLEQHGVAPHVGFGAAAAGVDWDAWEPGHPRAAALLAGSGFEEMLAASGVVIQGIDHTTMERIARVLEAGLRAGTGVEKLAQEIDAIVENPSRAQMIAATEVCRAMTRAAVTQYSQHGIAEFNLLTSAGACPQCVAIAAANPHPVTDLADTPPIHPNCRCAAAPVVGH